MSKSAYFHRKPFRRSRPWQGTAAWFLFYTVGLAIFFFHFANLLDSQKQAQPAKEQAWEQPQRSKDRGEMVLVDASFGKCSKGQGYNCVIDGDTFLYQGRRIRIADINTPETYSPGCDREAELGAKATNRLLALLNQGSFALEPDGDRDEDRYGRLLRRVTRNGHSMGETLVAEGLAHRWAGHRQSWCG